MVYWGQARVLMLAIAVIALGCGTPESPSAREQPGTGPEKRALAKQITLAIMSDPPSISTLISGGGGRAFGGSRRRR